VNIHDLVVGDIMHIEAGDVIPVDAVLVDGYNIVCDESAATGESDSVKKVPADVALQSTQPGAKFNRKYDPFILSGCKVLGGVGRGIVTAVGVNSYHGRTLMGTFLLAPRHHNSNTPTSPERRA
jgi:P-type Ca2+ transporter type 2C